MNEFDLNATLKAAKIPEPSEEFLNDLPRQVTSQLRREPTSQRNSPRWFPRLAWGLATVAVCLAVTFAIGYRRGSSVIRLVTSAVAIDSGT